MRHRALAVLCFFTFALAPLSARANSITFTLDAPTQYANAGKQLTFAATVTAGVANAGDVFLVGDTFNLAAPLGLDDSNFFANFPFSLAPGKSFHGDLFTVSIPNGTAQGAYLGDFTLYDDSSNSLGTVNYSVNVTPEPSTFLLMGTGLAGIAITMRRKRTAEV